MAWKNWLDLTPSDYMNISIMGDVDQNITHVRNLIKNYLHASPEYTPIDVSQGYHTQPTPEYLNKIERNIENLKKELTWIVDSGASRIWLGENKDNPTFRYSDVNRWFKDLLVMKLSLNGIPSRWRISGTFSCGNNYSVQMIRR